ncbi:TIR domain-containing protein [Halanaerobium congolense]|uniref:TIR domain-containing protein n=2 Tax=Halanaerobium TaxID=2330 RepID=A0A4R7E136_9FIRM|nr:TIR domain-containing protein [Halanaerobium congolense]TDS28027.1 TIR domain-containing protein [Halanaerobium congolense]
MYKTPFQIYILWHDDFNPGKELAEYIFKKINRDPDNITFKEIGIPVKFRNLEENELNIQYDDAAKTAIVILVDDHMTIDPKWEKYITNIRTNSDVLLFPVAINSNSFSFHRRLKKSNFIRMNDLGEIKNIFNKTEDIDEIDFQKIFLLNQLLHEFTRELYSFDNSDPGSPLKIFISHTKTDGIDTARKLKKYIDSITRADSFFDATDIEVGYEFWEKIKREIDNSFLVMINSDKYSNSSWCRKEVLLAKKSNRPILNINTVENEEIRSFPYMGNVKSIRINKESGFKDYFYVITEIYREAVRYKYNELKLKKFLKEEGLNSKYLVNYPELLDFCNGDLDDKSKIVYPDPPLSEEEINLLKKDNEYFTPLTYFLKNRNLLKDKKIAFSISETSKKQKELKFYVLKNVMSELVRYIFYFGGDIYYGGSLKYDEEGNFNLLKTMLEVLELYFNYEKADDKRIYNYVPQKISNKISVNYKARYKNLLEIIECGQNEGSNITKDKKTELEEWIDDLSIMRNKIIDEIDAVILMGGKYFNYSGKYPGLLEEFLLAIKKQKTIFLLGGFGGVTKEIINLLKGKDSEYLSEVKQLEKNSSEYRTYYSNNIILKYSDIKDKINNLDYRNLNNGLSEEENRMLFRTEDSHQIISLIIKGLASKK